MNMKAFYLQEKYFKAFCGLFIFSMIYIFPIILANFYYVDDLLRSMSGAYQSPFYHILLYYF